MKAELRPKEKKALFSLIVKASVASRTMQQQFMIRADHEAARRHQAVLRAIDRWDMEQQIRPYIPTLANSVLRNDELQDISPVIQTIIDQAGPCPDTILPAIDYLHFLFSPLHADTPGCRLGSWI